VLSADQAETAIARVVTGTSLEEAVADVDLVIEAVVEDLDVKRALFTDLDRLAPANVILATNSSTIMVSEITEQLAGRARTLAMHFFNPALVMRLVEIAPAPYTEPKLIEDAEGFVTAIDREPVVMQREVTGLLVNRVLWALRREAMWLADNGYAEPRDIDRAIKLGLNHPMGPFELADFNGLDVVLSAQRHRFARTGDDADSPPRILERLVEQGYYGRKSGKGFYDYPATDSGAKERP
jgi:3-hydroxybutyryl-CoA dehydrogenase